MQFPVAAVRSLLDRGSPQPQRFEGIELKLDSNESPPPPAALFEALRDPLLLSRYPDATRLERLLAGRLGVEPAQVLVTCGADDALFRACAALLEPGRELVLPAPTFEMIERYAVQVGATIATVDWPEGPYPVEDVLARVGARTALVGVVSPNNPTGAVASRDDLARLSRGADGAWLLCDFAYAEFADEDLTSAALALPNALVFRTLSKAYGLAGLRIGYVVGPAEAVGWLRAAGQPYAVSSVSLALAEAGLAADLSTDLVARVRSEREELARVLRDLGARPRPSQANFVLADMERPLDVRAALAQEGIGVRAFPGRAGLESALRITCPGSREGMARLTAGLERALGEPRATGDRREEVPR